MVLAVYGTLLQLRASTSSLAMSIAAGMPRVSNSSQDAATSAGGISMTGHKGMRG